MNLLLATLIGLSFSVRTSNDETKPLDYEIAVKELNIEKARLSPSASLNYSKSENNDLSVIVIVFNFLIFNTSK